MKFSSNNANGVINNLNVYVSIKPKDVNFIHNTGSCVPSTSLGAYVIVNKTTNTENKNVFNNTLDLSF